MELLPTWKATSYFKALFSGGIAKIKPGFKMFFNPEGFAFSSSLSLRLIGASLQPSFGTSQTLALRTAPLGVN
jgi:hypothetical protein